MNAAAVSRTAPGVPALLHGRRWLVWRYEQLPGREKPTKVPYVADVGERRADVTNPDDLRTVEEATAVADRFDGIGVALGDGETGIDLDRCRNPETGEIAVWARRIIELIDSYAEVSPSNTGVHILCWGELPEGLRHRCDMPADGRMEVYDGGRYFTWTGNHLPGTPDTIRKRQFQLNDLCERHLMPEASSDHTSHTSTGQTPTPTLTETTDTGRLRAAFSAANGAEIAALWRGDDLHHPTPSEADAALAHYLAFYARGAGDLEALLRRSARVREKWNSRRGSQTWIERECRAAMENVQARYTASPPRRSAVVRIDRRLLKLDDEALYLAALIAAGVDDDDLADVAGVCDRTVRRWWADLREAGLEAVARTRPTRRFVEVPRDALLDDDLTKGEKVTLLHLAAFMEEGRATVSQEQLGKRRRREPARVGEDLRAAARQGYIGATVPARFCNSSGRRFRPNTYWWRDSVLAREAPLEATGTTPRTRGARGRDEQEDAEWLNVAELLQGEASEVGGGHQERVTTEVLPQEGGPSTAVAVAGGSTLWSSPEAESASLEGESRSEALDVEGGAAAGSGKPAAPPVYGQGAARAVARAVKAATGEAMPWRMIVRRLEVHDGDIEATARELIDLLGPGEAPHGLPGAERIGDEAFRERPDQVPVSCGWLVPRDGPIVKLADVEAYAEAQGLTVVTRTRRAEQPECAHQGRSEGGH